MMRFEILTLFPEYFEGPLRASLLGKAAERGLVEVRVTDFRGFAPEPHRVVDDAPYGGGSGMVLKPEPLVAAIEAARARDPGTFVAFCCPRGRRFDQALARELAQRASVTLVCGHYEGFDERVYEWGDAEISIGDYVLSGGEPAALVVLDAVARLLPGFVGNAESLAEESFEQDVLEYPHYTRPEEFRGRRVPAVLRSGDHARVRSWRRRAGLELTKRRRPDLIDPSTLTPEERAWLADGEES